MRDVNRREFIYKSILGVGVTASFSNSWASVVSKAIDLQDIDIIIELTAQKSELELIKDKNTIFWSYKGNLIKGRTDTLTTLPNSYLGPTINVQAGDRVRIIFKNELSEKSIVHWHGLDVSYKNDGHPHHAVSTGQTYEYDFEVSNRAGMYWYHPHPHGRTGFQVYHGLAGLFVVRDAEEKNLNLPSEDQELKFVLQDRLFDTEGQLDYRPSMGGAFGDKLLINGNFHTQPIKVKQGTYRIRLQNGCNARIFNFKLSTSEKMTQIGSDGGLLGAAKELERFYFAPAERIDLIIDFSKYNVGEKIKLESWPLVEGRGSKFLVLEFEVLKIAGSKYLIPETLSRYKTILQEEAVNLLAPKQFELYPVRGKGWTISGRAYENDNYHNDELITFGDTEIWEFYNPTGMPHPMHIHGTQFQVLERNSGSLKGCLDYGWKDTVLVMPRDRVKVIKRFNSFKGTFIYHCHNLEHEDMSMMRNYKIE